MAITKNLKFDISTNNHLGIGNYIQPSFKGIQFPKICTQASEHSVYDISEYLSEHYHTVEDLIVFYHSNCECKRYVECATKHGFVWALYMVLN